MRGVGLETAKNLILAGPNTVTIHDDNLVTMNDLSTNFFAKEEDVGKQKRSDSVYKELKRLNPYVKVDLHHGDIKEKLLSNYNVVVLTDCHDYQKITAINDYCHVNNVGFIYGTSIGLFSCCFVDFGESHVIHDETNKEIHKSYVTNITKEKEARITTLELNNFYLHHLLKFSNVKGMTEINGENVYKVVDRYSTKEFTIDCDTTNFNSFEEGSIGIIT